MTLPRIIKKDFPENLNLRFTNSTGSAIAVGKLIARLGVAAYVADSYSTPSEGNVANGDQGVLVFGAQVEYTAVAAEIWAQLQPLYLDTGNDRLTSVVTSVPAGYAAEAKAENATRGKVNLLLPLQGLSESLTLSFTPAAGSSNVCEVTIAVKDHLGNIVPGVWPLDIWLSDAATGVGLTGTTASGTVAVKSTEGTDFAALTAKKAIRGATKAAGTYILSITDSAKTGFYIAGTVPGRGVAAVSAQLVTANYGA